MKETNQTGYRRGGGVIAALLHEVVKRERFETYGDLAEALKVACAARRIAYDSARIWDAIDQVEASSRRRLIAAVRPPAVVEREPDRSRELDQRAAADCLRMVEDRLGVRLR